MSPNLDWDSSAPNSYLQLVGGLALGVTDVTR